MKTPSEMSIIELNVIADIIYKNMCEDNRKGFIDWIIEDLKNDLVEFRGDKAWSYGSKVSLTNKIYDRSDIYDEKPSREITLKYNSV